jgi:hypothetical protein
MFKKIITGQANFLMLVYHLLPESLKNENFNPKYSNEEKVREAFIISEATTLCTRDRVIDIFKDVKMKKDDFEKLHK